MDRFEMTFCRSRRVRQGANWIEAGGRVWFAEELPLGASKPAALNVAAVRALMSTAVSPTQPFSGSRKKPPGVLKKSGLGNIGSGTDYLFSIDMTNK